MNTAISHEERATSEGYKNIGPDKGKHKHKFSRTTLHKNLPDKADGRRRHNIRVETRIK